MVDRVLLALAAHCVWFAALHVAWAAGWRWGVPREQAPISERPVFLAYDVAAGGTMLVLAVVCLSLARGTLSGGVARRAARGLAGVAIVCGVRGGGGLVGDVMALGAREPLSAVAVVADAWFVVTTVLSGVAWWLLRHHDRHFVHSADDAGG